MCSYNKAPFQYKKHLFRYGIFVIRNDGYETVLFVKWEFRHRQHDDVIKWKHFPLLALCAGNSPVTGEFPSQRPVTWIFDVFFDLCLNQRLNKQSWGWWFETQSCTLWRHFNDMASLYWGYRTVSVVFNCLDTKTHSTKYLSLCYITSYTMTIFDGTNDEHTCRKSRTVIRVIDISASNLVYI